MSVSAGGLSKSNLNAASGWIISIRSGAFGANSNWAIMPRLLASEVSAGSTAESEAVAKPPSDKETDATGVLLEAAMPMAVPSAEGVESAGAMLLDRLLDKTLVGSGKMPPT